MWILDGKASQKDPMNKKMKVVPIDGLPPRSKIKFQVEKNDTPLLYCKKYHPFLTPFPFSHSKTLSPSLFLSLFLSLQPHGLFYSEKSNTLYAISHGGLTGGEKVFTFTPSQKVGSCCCWW